MLEVRGDLDLREESLDAEDSAELGIQDLDRDESLMAHVSREIHGSHPTAADLALDAVAITKPITELFGDLHFVWNRRRRCRGLYCLGQGVSPRPGQPVAVVAAPVPGCRRQRIIA